jgi:eukaryotic-like serine/threonine-protein kinase
MSNSESEQYDLLDRMAEEFAARFRRGERPALKEYIDRYPELADEIRELFPAMVRVEQIDEVRVDDEVTTGAPAKSPRQIGDYRILSEIGRGGMGVVYEAEQISLGRRVALKVLPQRAAADRMTLERFRREARAAARLHHTNIVPVFEVGQDGDVRFYAMQFIQGQSLDAVITELRHLRIQSQSRASGVVRPNSSPESRTLAPSVAQSILAGGFLPDEDRRATSGILPEPTAAEPARVAGALAKAAAVGLEATEAGPSSDFAPDSSSTPTPHSSAVLPGGTQLSVAEMSHRVFHRSVAHIGRQAASALAHAHARAVIHRDIKPSNLLLDTDGVVWVADFGLAKADDDGLTQTGDVLGTIRYMAPERFSGKADQRSDLYALGLTLYELLVLRAAFDSPNRLALIDLVKNVDPPRPRTIDPRIPLDLETIVLKAVEKDPKARYVSADAMSEDLRRFLADEPIQARQISTAERYWRWARRNPMVATLGGVVTALLVAVTVGSMLAAAYFKESARRETNLAAREQFANQQSQRDRKEALEARRLAINERDHSRRQSADLALDKGIALAEAGHADRGLLWMLEALKTAPADAEKFRRMVRWNLGAWLAQVHKVFRIIDIGGRCDACAFSPDGRSFATGFSPRDRSLARPIDLWDTTSGRKLSTLPGTFAPFAFRPDGKVLVAQGDERRMVAVDLATGRVLWTTPPLPGIYGAEVDFVPDASTILASRYDTLESTRWLVRLDAVTGQPRGEPLRGLGWVTVDPEGRTVATGRVENGKAYGDVHELPSFRRAASWRVGGLGIDWLRFGPDARSLFASVHKGGMLFDLNSHIGQIWEPGTGRPTSPLMRSTRFASFTPSADSLVTLTDDLWLVRDPASGRVRGSGSAADSEVSPASHPDGRTVLSASRDRTVRLWQISADAEPVSSGGTETQDSMTWIVPQVQMRDLRIYQGNLLTDGSVVVSPASGAAGRVLIRLADPATGRPMGRPASHHAGWAVRNFALSHDARCFATGSNPPQATGEVRIWDAGTGRLRFPPMPTTNYVGALAFQPDGKALVAGDYSGLVRFWDTSTGKEIGHALPQGEIVMSLAFSPDGKMLAVGLANDHTGKAGVRLWDIITRRSIGDLLPHARRVRTVEFRPDGAVLLAGDSLAEFSTQLWDTKRGRPLCEPIAGEASGGFRHDGRSFLTVGEDGTVKLRDATTGEVLVRLLSSSSPAICAAFRGEGDLVAAGFADGAVRLCDPATAHQVGPPRFMSHPVSKVVFTSDGRSVVAIDDFGDSRIWPVPEPLHDGSVDDLMLRIEARTGLRMDTGLAISRLDSATWRDQLEQLGRLDPTSLRPDDDPAWHEPMIREAERNGNAFAALWHLDRLIAARPDDWFLYARRARAWSSSDKFDKAAADYQQAERLSSRDRVLDFQAHCESDCTRAERWAEALWYLDRLIAARPDDGLLHEDRAAVYGKLGREADRQSELARVFELRADEGMVVPRAEELGRAGRWTEAAGLLARCGRTSPLSRELAQAWGIACLKAGDRAGYREACIAVTTNEEPNRTIVWNVLSAASLFALGPEGLNEYQEPIGLLERRLTAVPAPSPLYRHVFSNALGGLLLRAGRIDEAIARLNAGISVAKEADGPGDWAYLALANARKGHRAEARRWLDRLRTWRPDSSVSFWDVQELALLQSEAELRIFDAEFPDDPFHGPRPR